MKYKSSSELDIKLGIMSAAIDLYLNEPDSFTMKRIAEAAECTKSEVTSRFPTKSSVLRFFYTSIPERYEIARAAIPEYDSFSLSEKLSNYVYTSLDFLNENREFAEKTFKRFVLDHPGTHPWKTYTGTLFREVAQSDPHIPSINRMILQPFVFQILASEFLQLIRYWLYDAETDSDRTLAFTDKSTAFFQELAYSGVLDRGIDLARFVFSNGLISERLKAFTNSNCTRNQNQHHE